MSFMANRALNFAQVVFMRVEFFFVGVKFFDLGARTVTAQAFSVAYHVAGFRRAVVADCAGQFFGGVSISKRGCICCLRKYKRKGKRAKKLRADMHLFLAMEKQAAALLASSRPLVRGLRG